MKEIKILQTGVDPIVIYDNDEMDLNEYTKKISSLLEMRSVVILETSSGNVIVRPHQVASIEVSEIQDQSTKNKKGDNKPKYVDMITNGDES